MMIYKQRSSVEFPLTKQLAAIFTAGQYTAEDPEMAQDNIRFWLGLDWWVRI